MTAAPAGSGVESVTEPASRRFAVDLPAPFADNAIMRESLWFDYASGADHPAPPPWMWDVDPAMDDHVPPVLHFPGTVRPLPERTAHALGYVPFPHGTIAADDDPWRLERALVAAFGIQWYDPDNPYKVHRCYASPRCAYPVQVFLERDGEWSHLDLERHQLVGVRQARDGKGTQAPTRIILAGHYTRVPAGYKWLRSSLVGYELGIMLRALAMALATYEQPARVVLPGELSSRWLDVLGLDTSHEWSLPVVVELGETEDQGRAIHPPHAPAEPTKDLSLELLVEANRTQLFPADPVSLTSGKPDQEPTGASVPSWSHVLWSRNSGRMPRGMHGMSSRPAPLSGESLLSQLRWLSAPPPGPVLRAVLAETGLDVVLRDVQGFSDGHHRLVEGRLEPWRTDASILGQLETEYGYSQSPEAGCDLRHASATWFLTVRPRDLVARFGPAGWNAIQYVSGWAIHGLCLSVAGSDLFARPTRAFKEAETQRILDRQPDEMVALAAVVGHPRHESPRLIDLRR